MIGIVAANDPGSTRLVYAMVVGLAVIGVLLVVLGVWLIRQTRVDPPLLGPLERMGERDWSKRDAPTQRRLLDEVRPEGAAPLRPEPDPPVIDEDFNAIPATASLHDLGPGLGIDAGTGAASEPDRTTESWPEPAQGSSATRDEAASDLPHQPVADSWNPPLPAPDELPAPGVDDAVHDGLAPDERDEAVPEELPAPETSG